ncbi:YtxH domain-containing protein [Panacibacter ginsenosidivorans]|uniref:YtxH domain-containing protein n=1 Tax=Panacibacter ginsenosidivorans TaxID=1813871 RepID=A0A5B8V8G5_9BACT|nr:YtxH domain-containing protein [Panacibacter ginsenosidivorans]QEC67830.1 YtxH domain-containing protein [Panacibacter ginsenosidivorans]
MRLTTFIKGVSIGFILGVLFAPDKGSATRRKISGVASDIKDDMTDTLNDISDMVSEKITAIKNMVSDMTNEAEDEYNDLSIGSDDRV